MYYAMLYYTDEWLLIPPEAISDGWKELSESK